MHSEGYEMTMIYSVLSTKLTKECTQTGFITIGWPFVKVKNRRIPKRVLTEITKRIENLWKLQGEKAFQRKYRKMLMWISERC